MFIAWGDSPHRGWMGFVGAHHDALSRKASLAEGGGFSPQAKRLREFLHGFDKTVAEVYTE